MFEFVVNKLHQSCRGVDLFHRKIKNDKVDLVSFTYVSRQGWTVKVVRFPYQTFGKNGLYTYFLIVTIRMVQFLSIVNLDII